MQTAPKLPFKVCRCCSAFAKPTRRVCSECKSTYFDAPTAEQIAARNACNAQMEATLRGLLSAA